VACCIHALKALFAPPDGNSPFELLSLSLSLSLSENALTRNRHLRNPTIAAKMQVLIDAGIVSVK
jgi:hypothetical protein